MLCSFEMLDELNHYFSKNDISVCEWILIELYAHRDIEHPITNRQICAKKSNYHYCMNKFAWTTLHKETDICQDCNIVFKDHYKLTGIKVRSMVHAMRHIGFPVGSRGTGYYWIHTEDDADVTLTHMNQRLRSQEESRDDILRAKRRLKDGPAKLDLPMDQLTLLVG